MAQPTSFRPVYLGSMNIEANKTYDVVNILANPKFTSATAIMLKTDEKRNDPVRVSINGTPGFPIYLNETTAIDRTASLGDYTYTFTKNCIIVLLRELEVTI